MKILQINAVYGHGSTGIIVRDLEHMCEQQHDMVSYVASQDVNVVKAIRGYRIGNGLDHKLHALFCRIGGKQAYFSQRTTKRFLKYLDVVKPDIVHLHIIHNNYIHLNMLLNHLAKRNIKTVVTFHDCWFFTGGCFHYTNVNCNKWMYQCGTCVKQKEDYPAYFYDASSQILEDRVKYFSAIPNLTFVGCSQWITSEISKSRLKTCGKILCLHNGFDLKTFYPRVSNLREKLHLDNRFVILGPASKWLQPINQVELNYFITNMPKDCILLLFGCKEKNMKVADNVLLYGFTHNRDELAELYSMADVMVNCSREDTLSSLNLECQACGTPVVTYDATGNKETVDNNSSFSVLTKNYKDLFDKTLYIRNKGKQCFSKHCCSFVEKHFEKNKNYKKYIEIYRALMEN